MPSDEDILELIRQVGKLVLVEGMKWRLAHSELMDAYDACTVYRKDAAISTPIRARS